ncbi:hypothetical protein JXA80_06015 [bacterium]|nr:hypothetical protein [candidate division CSSED10-310 bacterium]
MRVIGLIPAVALLISVSAQSSQPTPSPTPAMTMTQLTSQQDWTRAESVLLRNIWDCQTCSDSTTVLETLGRICIYLHKAPMAMEWLEQLREFTQSSPDQRARIDARLHLLHRIYLPDTAYNHDPRFHLTGIDLESPVDIQITADNRLIVMDRYRLIQLVENPDGVHRPVPPTSALPDDSRSLQLVDGEPVVVTQYGFWKQNRLNHFGNQDELTRIIDAVFTAHSTWLVLDRRHAQMLQFTADGTRIDTLQIPPLNGNERLLAGHIGGNWLMKPESRQILFMGSGLPVTIPFQGPGYALDDPIDLATDWFGHLYVLCSDHTVTIFSPQGVRLRHIHLDPGRGIIREAHAIAVGSDGRIFIADRKKHAIVCFR